MRLTDVRPDLLICMVLAGLIYVGAGFLCMEFDVLEKFIGAVTWLGQIEWKDVPDGEVGGFATEDTPCVSTAREVVELAAKGETFTVEVPGTRYLNYGTFQGENYVWRILKLMDDVSMVVRLNTAKIQDGSTWYMSILPVGKVVEEPPESEVLEEMRAFIGDPDMILVDDMYIDMDGEGNITYISTWIKILYVVVSIILEPMPFWLFVLYIVLVFWIHSFFVKYLCFPPVFPNKKW